MTTPPSLSALVECKALIDAMDAAEVAYTHYTLFGPDTERLRDEHTAASYRAALACIAYVRSLPATQSGLCHDCENKKLREVLSAPRPDVSLGDAALIEAVCRAYCAHNGWDADEPVTYSGTRTKAHNMDGSVAVQWQMHTDDAEFYLSALRAQSPAEGGWLPIESAPDRGWFLGYVPIDRHRLLLCFKSAQGLILGTDFLPPQWPVFMWHPLPPKPFSDGATPTAIALRESQAEGKGECVREVCPECAGWVHQGRCHCTDFQENRT